MPLSLVFLEQVPTYVYQNVNFQATVKLVDSHEGKATCLHKPLRVSLRFHDTYELVDAHDAELRLASDIYLEPHTGIAELSMSLHTFAATCDGRNFCLEVRSVDSEIEPVFSSLVHVVKEKLHIVAQPPDVWFKDEGGREKCMAVALTLVPAPGAYLEDRVVPLAVQLLYESGALVINQGILRLFPNMRPNMTQGRATISFRIDDVSKNHQGQSFLLEIGPEQQDGSSMFQDIAPTRTSVIAIRSKRNKRKLNAQAVAAAANGTRASPRSVAGTPRTSYVNVHPSPRLIGGPGSLIDPYPPRPRKYVAPSNARGYYTGTIPQQPMGSISSWSNHMVQPPVPSVSSTQPRASASQVPIHSPGAVPGTSPDAVEWALYGFEIRSDGSVNPARPIYRCPQCRRLNDVDTLAAGPALSHSPQCVFSPENVNGNMRYRSQMEGTPMNQIPVPQAYAPVDPPYLAPSTSPCETPALVDLSAFNVQQNTINISSTLENVSPKTVAPFDASSSQQLSMAMSPCRLKGPSEDLVPSPGGFDEPSGNLFESNTFHNQMELMGTSTETLVTSKSNGVEDDSALNVRSEHSLTCLQDATLSLGGVIGTSLFNEMTSMGIKLDQHDPHLPSGLEVEAGPLISTGEDQVYYILARMYTNALEQKLGLPAFDQFHQMLGFYREAQDNVQTQVVFRPLLDGCLSDDERENITSRFIDELQRDSRAVHSFPKYQHNLIMLREDALMFYWSQSLDY